MAWSCGQGRAKALYIFLRGGNVLSSNVWTRQLIFLSLSLFFIFEFFVG